MHLSSPQSLDADAAAAIRGLAAEIESADGQPPLSDQALAQLSSASVRHAVATEDDLIVGYAQLAGDSLELTGASHALAPLLDVFADQPLLVWSHGARSRLLPVLADTSLQPVRTLLQLRRPLTAIAARPVPDGVRIVPFVVGRDEDAWVRVNTAAFAGHPEQGQWTAADVLAREAEPWFDPGGFLLAWQGETLLGYHWTKQHSPTLGEVYVLGIDPAAQGLGLGGVLLDAGLAYLHDRGCTEVLLYVEADNEVALRLYQRAGFTEYDSDTQWERT